jgi:copper chaperone CopZ
MSNCCGVEPISKQSTEEEMAETTQIALAISGMGCMSCAGRVGNSLLRLPGVVEANVNHMNGIANLIYNPKMTGLSDLFQAVVQAGGDGRHNYSARLIT